MLLSLRCDGSKCGQQTSGSSSTLMSTATQFRTRAHSFRHASTSRTVNESDFWAPWAFTSCIFFQRGSHTAMHQRQRFLCNEVGCCFRISAVSSPVPGVVLRGVRGPPVAFPHFGPASLDFHLNRPVISLIQLHIVSPRLPPSWNCALSYWPPSG